MEARSEYVIPDVEDYGSVLETTAGTSDGDCTDAAFPAKTARGDLTFSTC